MTKKLIIAEKNFQFEREGQIQFFIDLEIEADVELTHNTAAHALPPTGRF